MNWRAIKAIAVTSSLFLMTVVGGCGRKPAEKTPVPVKVTAVELNSASTEAKYSATIIPRTEVDLAFKVGGSDGIPSQSCSPFSDQVVK